MVASLREELRASLSARADLHAELLAKSRDLEAERQVRAGKGPSARAWTAHDVVAYPGARSGSLRCTETYCRCTVACFRMTCNSNLTQSGTYV